MPSGREVIIERISEGVRRPLAQVFVGPSDVFVVQSEPSHVHIVFGTAAELGEEAPAEEVNVTVEVTPPDEAPPKPAAKKPAAKKTAAKKTATSKRKA